MNKMTDTDKCLLFEMVVFLLIEYNYFMLRTLSFGFHSQDSLIANGGKNRIHFAPFPFFS